MTSNLREQSDRRSYLTLAILVVFAIATFCLTRPATSTESLSPVSGLVTLRAMAQQSDPLAQALESGKPMVLEFYTNWCTTCQAMAPDVQQLHDTYGPTVNFVMLNIDDPQWSGQVERYHVRGVPEFFLLDSNQQLSDSFVGKVPKPMLSRAIEKILS